jgi:hypothetical protein
MTTIHRYARVAFIAGIVLSPATALACASCGCSLSSDWESLGLSTDTPFRLDVRYDFLNQDQLRSGTRTISPVAASQVTHDGNPQEVESYTKNNYTTVSLDATVTPQFALNLQVPFIQRSHSTLGTASDGITPGPDGGEYTSKTANLGDIKLIGRYRGFLENQAGLGVLFGLKLPSGTHSLNGASTDPTDPDPVPIDRGLQPGTGTTDVIVGAYYSGDLSDKLGFFAQALYQVAIKPRDQYRPGNGSNLSAGLRYSGLSYLTPQVQVNVRHSATDSGANADTISTGGTLVYVSPGVVAPVTAAASVYAFAQLPVYQNVKGVQLAPRYTVSIGARYAF